jgi:hypothetical protein
VGEERSKGKEQLLTAKELSERSRLSISTIHRLKLGGRIPFIQPAGKGGRVFFPPDAIERCASADPVSEPEPAHLHPRHLSGPCPGWMQVLPTETKESDRAT